MSRALLQLIFLGAATLLAACAGPGGQPNVQTAAQGARGAGGLAAATEAIAATGPWREEELALIGEPSRSAAPFGRSGLPFVLRVQPFGVSTVAQLAVAGPPESLSGTAVLQLNGGGNIAEFEAADGRLVQTSAGPATLFPATWSARLAEGHLERSVKGDGRIDPTGRAPFVFVQMLGAGGSAAATGLRDDVRVFLYPDDANDARRARERREGRYVTGPEAYAYAAAALDEYDAQMLELSARRAKLGEIYAQVQPLAVAHSTAFALKRACGEVPLAEGAARIVLKPGTTSADALRRAEAYPACAERVRAAIDREAHARAWEQVAPLVSAYAELGGAVEAYYGASLSIRGLGFPSPEEVEAPIDRALAQLAGTDFSADRRNVAAQEARERRRREAEAQARRARAARISAEADALAQRAQRELIEARARAAVASGGGAGGGAFSMRRGEGAAATGPQSAPLGGPTGQDAYQAQIAENERRHAIMMEASRRDSARWRCVQNPNCTPAPLSPRPSTATAQ